MLLFSNKRRFQLGINFFLLILLGGIQIIYPLYLSKLIDASLTSNNIIYNGVRIISILLLAKFSMQILQTFFSSRVGWGILAELRKKLCNKLLSMEYLQISNQNVGTVTQTVEIDTEQLVNFYTSFLGIIIKDSILLLGVCTMAFLTSPILGFVLSILSSIMFLWFYIINRNGKTAWTDTKEANAQFLNVFCEVFRSMDTYHFIRQTNFLGKILEKALSNFFRYDFVSSYLSYRYWIASLSVFGLAKIIVLIFGISVVWNEHISLGTVYLFIYYIDMLSDPVEELRLQLEDIPAICAAENRIRAILNTNASMTYGERNLDGEVKSVCIKNVDFLYDNKAVFSNFSKTFIQGNVYALVGPSGIGKSTLLNLVVRLYDCASGSIEINGIPVSDYKKGEIAKEVCYLHQIVASKITVAEYFHGLLVDSLKFKQFYFDLLKVNTIEWNRRISEMSRGEQQALVLIRALMTDKSLVLLDEIFDSIDNVNVNYALNQLRKQKKTIVVITHEQEVMDKCDQIVKLA